MRNVKGQMENDWVWRCAWPLHSNKIEYNLGMAKYLDVATWGRRHLFEFFRHYTNPYFNICAQLDVTRLLEILQPRREISTSLTYLYFALRAANETEPF
ncbi:MAG TPA: hypothetical protein VFH31_09415, partial [Pyrinomonadaceae bacterium]|nr:hypothetical protein [Pyrinomonadaceae bacterium]